MISNDAGFWDTACVLQGISTLTSRNAVVPAAAAGGVERERRHPAALGRAALPLLVQGHGYLGGAGVRGAFRCCWSCNRLISAMRMPAAADSDPRQHLGLLVGADDAAAVFETGDLIEVQIAVELGTEGIDLLGGDGQVLLFGGDAAQLGAYRR